MVKRYFMGIALSLLLFLSTLPLKTSSIDNIYLTPFSSNLYVLEVNDLAMIKVNLYPTTNQNLYNLSITNSFNKTILTRKNETGMLNLNFIGEGIYYLIIFNLLGTELVFKLSFSYNIIEKQVGDHFITSDGILGIVKTITPGLNETISLSNLEEENYFLKIIISDFNGKIEINLFQKLNSSTNGNQVYASFSITQYYKTELSLDEIDDKLRISSIDEKIHIVTLVFEPLLNYSISFTTVILIVASVIGLLIVTQYFEKKKGKKKQVFQINADELKQQTMLATIIDQRNPSGPYIPVSLRKIHYKKENKKEQ